LEKVEQVEEPASPAPNLVRLTTLPLLEFIHELTPNFRPPTHLIGWTQLIERALTERVRGMVSVPIRHHKTWTTIHGIAWHLVRRPGLRIIGMCADHERAQELGNMTRRTCEAAGVGPVRGENKALDWKNKHGGGVVWMSASQSSLGKDVDLLVVDDPLSEFSALDAASRDAVDHAIALYTNRATGSVLMVASRLHPDDPIGRRLLRRAVAWEYVHNQALIDEDKPTERAFAPDVMDLAEIKRRRAEAREADPAESIWHAQWQNEPRSALDSRVREPKRYEFVPSYPGFRYAIGVDLAYQAGEKNDYFACVIMKIYGSQAYVIDVIREKPDFNAMQMVLKNKWELYGRCGIFSYVAGPELGAVRYFTDRGIPIQPLAARYSKAYRAQRTIDRWNAGQILVPVQPAWAPGFVARALLFTGNERERDDDEFDALVSVCDAMFGGAATGVSPHGVGHRRWGRADVGAPSVDPRSFDQTVSRG
jgi:hypothetical protein